MKGKLELSSPVSESVLVTRVSDTRIPRPILQFPPGSQVQHLAISTEGLGELLVTAVLVSDPILGRR